MKPTLFAFACLTSATGLLGGCGEGLTTELATPTDGGDLAAEADPPATLGSYGVPCGVLGNSQPAYASFSPTGDTVAVSVGGPGHVELHATSDGHLVTGFDAHFGRLTALAFSPNDDVLATAGLDGMVRLWRAGMPVAELQVFARPIAALVWSHGGTSLAVTSHSGALALVRASGSSLAVGWTSDGDFRAEEPMFSPDDAVLVVRASTDDIFHRLLRVADGTQISLGGWSSGLYLRAQSPDGSKVAYVDNFIQHVTISSLVWQADDVVGTMLWQRGFPGTKGEIAFTADSKYVAIWSVGDGAPVNLFDAENGNLLGPLPWTGNATWSVTFSADGRFALVMDYDDAGGAVRLVDLATGGSVAIGKQPGSQESLGGNITTSADSTMMVNHDLYQVDADTYRVRAAVWNLGTRQVVSQSTWLDFGPSPPPNLSAAGDLLYGIENVPAVPDGSLYMDQVRFESLVDPTLSTRWPIGFHNMAVVLANDGRTMAGFYYLETLDWRLWIRDWRSGTTIADFSIGERQTDNLVFSPDGSQIALLRTDRYGGKGKDLSVWRVADGRLLFEDGVHAIAPRSLTFSPDGALLAIAGDGGSDRAGLEVYDARRWSHLRSLERSFNPRMTARFSPDGRQLLVDEGDGMHVYRTSDWQRYDTLGTSIFEDAVFMPGNQGVLEIATGVVWCGR